MKNINLINQQNKGFIGQYGIKNWVEHTSAPVSTLWNISKVPASVTLNTDPAWLVSTDWMTTTIAASGVVSFDWNCTSANGAKHPCSYNHNGSQVLLNTNTAKGTISVAVNPGDYFSFVCQSNDAVLTSLTISNFSAPIVTCTNFTGPYSVNYWTEHTSAPVASLWNIKNAPLSITLNTDPVWLVSTDWMTITIPAPGVITFDWKSTYAGSAHPCHYNHNGVNIMLNATGTSGTVSVQVNQGDYFSFVCQSNDAALNSLTLSNFSAPVIQYENFTGPYSITNWTEHTSAPVGSLWNISNVPTSVTLNSDPVWLVSTDWMNVTVVASGIIMFDWKCTYAGTSHPCSYSHNGIKIQLNTTTTSGSVSCLVNKGDMFSFICQSNDAAPTSLTISDFSATM